MMMPSPPGVDRVPPLRLPDAVSADDSSGTTIRLPLDLRDPLRLEALRTARKMMMREEWTLGLDEGEPSLLDADFSAKGVVWDVPLGQALRARTKLAALVRRAESALEAARRVTG